MYLTGLTPNFLTFRRSLCTSPPKNASTGRGALSSLLYRPCTSLDTDWSLNQVADFGRGRAVPFLWLLPVEHRAEPPGFPCAAACFFHSLALALGAQVVHESLR